MVRRVNILNLKAEKNIAKIGNWLIISNKMTTILVKQILAGSSAEGLERGFSPVSLSTSVNSYQSHRCLYVRLVRGLLTRAATLLAWVVRKVDNAIHRINHYPADSVVCFVNTYLLDSALSAG